jgi:hypothetical protein
MGQFIGRENAYSSINIFQNFQEIYNRQGIGGFFVYVFSLRNILEFHLFEILVV